jgi:hypothetical protein
MSQVKIINEYRQWQPHKIPYMDLQFSTLTDLQKFWKNDSETARQINEALCVLTNASPSLKRLRDFVEANAWGMGERSFYSMWWLIMRALPDQPVMMEIGVHRGQTLALWRMLNDWAHIIGVSPFDGAEVGEKRDYRVDIEKLFNFFNLADPDRLIMGYSDRPETIETCKGLELDLLYIDGGHSYETCKSDILNYAPLIKPGGYLVIDDCANRFSHPFGYFAGIDSVSKAVDELLPPFGDALPGFEHLFAVVHNRVWKKL